MCLCQQFSSVYVGNKSRVCSFGRLFASCGNHFIRFTGACMNSDVITRSVTVRDLVCC